MQVGMARFCSLLSTHWESGILVVSISLTSCSVRPRPLWAGLVARAPARFARHAREEAKPARAPSFREAVEGAQPSRKVFAALARRVVPGRACGSQGRRGRDVRRRWRRRRRITPASLARLQETYAFSESTLRTKTATITSPFDGFDEYRYRRVSQK